MTDRAVITTSWDDGHPLDLRVAEMLSKFGLKGTFYIPRKSERGTLSEARIRQLASTFEVGAHTLDHLPLTSVDPRTAERQIVDSKSWIEDVTGKTCAMFCPPLGRFTRRHIDMMRAAGFVGYRTVEFLSLDRPRNRGGILEMPTTLQAHPHGLWSYTKNALRRVSPGKLWLYIRHGGQRDWLAFAQRLLKHAPAASGVFHLWGHSWELEERAQWTRLEEALRILRDSGAQSFTNGDVCREGLAPPRAGRSVRTAGDGGSS